MPVSIPGNGKVLQVVSNLTTAKSSTTATIPSDNTTPQIGEGTQFLSVGITPKRPDSMLLVLVNACINHSSNDDATMAVFRDAGANAIAVASTRSYGESGFPGLAFLVAAGSVSATTFTVRYGGNTATAFLNQRNGVTGPAGTTSSIVVMEIAP